MAAWKSWTEKHHAAGVGAGGPLGKTKKITERGIDDVARHIRHLPGVEAAAVFGHALRIAGTDREQLRRAVGSFAGFDWHETEPRLEDVFIHQLAARETAK